ncbi:helix-turn-helix domain-containing protein, partial [Staphylococcus chromogenes]
YDHIIDLFINDYLEDYRLFINETQQIQSFAKYYERFPKQRLKFYKNEFDMFTYFEIKLIIICITKGVLHA